VANVKGAVQLTDPTLLITGATAIYGEEGFARDFGCLTLASDDRGDGALDGKCRGLTAGP
jgi:hypothetical protein